MSQPLNPKTVIKVVAEWFHLNPTEITGPKRYRHVVRARQIVMYLLREDGRSLTEVARITQRHHTTVIAAYHFIKQQRAQHPGWEIDLADLSSLIRQSP